MNRKGRKNMNERKAYEELIEARIMEWEAHMKRMEADAHRAHAEDMLEEGKPLSNLRGKLESLKERASDLKRANEEAWSDLRAGVASAASDIGEAFEKIKKDIQQA